MLTTRTNVSANAAVRNLGRSRRNLETSFARISSGRRINKAADDAAGLAIAEDLDMQQGSLRQAGRNINDGISMIQVAESSTNEVSNILKRMRELAVQASTGTVDTVQSGFIDAEFDELSAQIDSIAGNTSFNGFALADGTVTNRTLQIGIDNVTSDRSKVVFGDLSAATLGVDTAGIDLSNQVGAQTALAVFDGALSSVAGYRANYGEAENRLNYALNHTETYKESLAAAESRIRDADFAVESAEMVKNQIMTDASTAVLAQANQVNRSVVALL